MSDSSGTSLGTLTALDLARLAARFRPNAEPEIAIEAAVRLLQCAEERLESEAEGLRLRADGESADAEGSMSVEAYMERTRLKTLRALQERMTAALGRKARRFLATKGSPEPVATRVLKHEAEAIDALLKRKDAERKQRQRRVAKGVSNKSPRHKRRK